MEKNFNWSHLIPVVIGILSLWFLVLGGLWAHVAVLLHILSVAADCAVTEWFTYSDPTGPPPSVLDPMPHFVGALAF